MLQNGSASPAKGTKRKFVVDATKGASPGVNASNTGQHLHYGRKGNGPGKHAKLEDNKGATRLGRDQTPIGVFEDECVFCHSFRTSEPVICCISFTHISKKCLLKSSYLYWQ